MRVNELILSTLLGFVAAANYEGYKVFEVSPKGEVHNQILLSLENNPKYDFWSRINKLGNPISVMVSPAAQEEFQQLLARHEIPYVLHIENVEKTIKSERDYHESRPKHTKGARLDTTKYYRHEEINAYLDDVAERFPDIVTLENVGESYEGRSINLVRISTGESNPPKPVIFVDAGIHAREWIAPAVALYLINQLVEVPEHADLISNVTWVILPNVNPDGYEFCWTDDRLWRKTRSPGRRCYGADPNRNFDFHWMDVGATLNECDEIYAGTEAFSEVEARILRDAILNEVNANTVAAYITFHSYGPYFLYPWGYGPELPSNWRLLDDLAHAADDAIAAVAGTRYEIGSSTNVLYAASGASDDWSMGVAGIPIVYTMELPGGGLYGFDLPPRRITPVVIETFEGVKVIHDYVRDNARDLLVRRN